MDDDQMEDIDSSPHTQGFSIDDVLSSVNVPRSHAEIEFSEVADVHGKSELVEKEDVAISRLSRLYPCIDQKKTALPRYWSPADKHRSLLLSIDSLRVHYGGKGDSHKDAASVRANHAIPRNCGVYYYEVRIVRKGDSGFLGIGLCEKEVELNRLPGWDPVSYGYHGDDGNFFASSGKGTAYGPRFTTGDVIGCGLNFVSRTIFYTKNGEFLGVALSNVSIAKPLYPVIGMQTTGVLVDTNFGQRPFMFKIEKSMKDSEMNALHTIHEIPLPDKKSIWITEAVQSWLAVHGYEKTLRIFGKNCGIQERENPSTLTERRRIMKLIVKSNVSEAITRTNALCESVLKNNKELYLLLQIQEFIECYLSLQAKNSEIARDNSSPVPGTSTAPVLQNRNKRAAPELTAVCQPKRSSTQVQARSTNGVSTANGNSEVNGNDQSVSRNSHNDAERSLSSDEFLDISDDENADAMMEDDGRTDQFEILIALGQRISSYALTIPNLSPDLSQRMDDAFSIVCYEHPQDSPKKHLLNVEFRKHLAYALNSAILDAIDAKYPPPVDEYVKKVKELRTRALNMNIAPAVYASEKHIFDLFDPRTDDTNGSDCGEMCMDQ